MSRPERTCPWAGRLEGHGAGPAGAVRRGRRGPPSSSCTGEALGQHTYKAVLHRLADLGCRVVAPALPGFGGTPGLPREQFHLAGYAAWPGVSSSARSASRRRWCWSATFSAAASPSAPPTPSRTSATPWCWSTLSADRRRRGKVLTSDRRAAAVGLGPHFLSDVWPIRQATRVLLVILEDALSPTWSAALVPG